MMAASGKRAVKAGATAAEVASGLDRDGPTERPTVQDRPPDPEMVEDGDGILGAEGDGVVREIFV